MTRHPLREDSKWRIEVDTKKRTKDIKKKLKDLGYEVKHTHCREVLAVAHGYRNAHHLAGPGEISKVMNTFLPKEIYLTLGVSPNNTNEYFSELFRGVKVKFNQQDINSLIEARDFIRDRAYVVDLDVGLISPFEGIDEEFLEKPSKANDFLEQEAENFPLDIEAVLDILDEGEAIDSKDFYLENNIISSIDEELYQTYIRSSKSGISVVIHYNTKHEEVIFSSQSVSWEELDLENKSKR